MHVLETVQIDTYQDFQTTRWWMYCLSNIILIFDIKENE